jgi:hypothetical protein
VEADSERRGGNRGCHIPLIMLSSYVRTLDTLKSNPSVTKDKQFVTYVTQGPAAGALIHPSGPEALMGRRQP